jgi:hypothetical protein
MCVQGLLLHASKGNDVQVATSTSRLPQQMHTLGLPMEEVSGSHQDRQLPTLVRPMLEACTHSILRSSRPELEFHGFPTNKLPKTSTTKYQKELLFLRSLRTPRKPGTHKFFPRSQLLRILQILNCCTPPFTS